MTRKVTLAVLLAALVVGGCSTTNTNGQAPTVTTSVDPSSSVDGTPSAAPTGGPSVGSTPSKKPVSGPTFPTTAKAYGAALLTAWGAKNTSRVEQLAGSAAILQLRDPMSQDKQWTYVNCDASGDSTACLFRNSYGDEITVMVTTAALGQPTAATEALVDRTHYPSDRTGYASAFVEAWQHGNTQRMARLANSTTIAYFRSKTPLANFTATDMGGKVRVEPVSAGGGDAFTLMFEGTLGMAHAITGAAAS
jgi:hypothetical protein